MSSSLSPDTWEDEVRDVGEVREEFVEYLMAEVAATSVDHLMVAVASWTLFTATFVMVGPANVWKV